MNLKNNTDAQTLVFRMKKQTKMLKYLMFEILLGFYKESTKLNKNKLFVSALSLVKLAKLLNCL